MLDALDTDRLQALGDDPAAQYARAVIAQMQADLKFKQTKIEALDTQGHPSSTSGTQKRRLSRGAVYMDQGLARVFREPSVMATM